MSVQRRRYSDPSHYERIVLSNQDERRARSVDDRRRRRTSSKNFSKATRVLRAKKDDDVEVLREIFGVPTWTVKKFAEQGQYSTVYTAYTSQTMLKRALGRKLKKSLGAFVIPPGKSMPQYPVLIKLTDATTGRREACIVQQLQSAPTTTVCGMALTPRKSIPKLYGQGEIGKGRYMLVYEFLQNSVPVAKAPADLRRSPAFVDAYEKAVLSMWSAGVVHNDLHDNNVLIQPTGEVKIIDFGFGIKLPSSLRTLLLQRLCDPETAMDHPVLQSFIKKKQSEFGRLMFYWNVDGLRRVHKFLQ